VDQSEERAGFGDAGETDGGSRTEAESQEVSGIQGNTEAETRIPCDCHDKIVSTRAGVFAR
jgi:hypothetical protein